ncbi:hypothetical protein CY34DRAFT_810334 [Suillus luteus UH-Slu-Lm8-n1]|uniref:Unplaced genomic scaffold CY34scaffold_318, whole genome shotgun sequence n=1 Tax=Suillus luteus UH-Slu-Lm8-n1 TaxID=930992 RepID=A0A0D0AT89_9AGAM|nr:hypothetical protein CY34DRAFT_810334 [Suillus luteus UH-Slu-Lm8-n1]
MRNSLVLATKFSLSLKSGPRYCQLLRKAASMVPQARPNHNQDLLHCDPRGSRGMDSEAQLART